MTVINPNSISGITSITLPSGDGNVLTIHTNDGTERFRIDSSGNVKVGSACTISPDGDVFFTGVTTATTFTGAHSGSGANLTSLPAAQLTGALPAISGANLTGIAATDNVRTGILDVAGVSTFRNTMNVGAAVTISESGIEASGIGITVANINGGQIGGRKNIIINGAMQVAQRGTSFTNIADTGVIGSVDRIVMVGANLDELAFAGKQTSDGPDGFKKCFEFDVTTAENALDANDLAYIRYKIEGQDLVPLFNADGTGKDFTLSFYVKAYQAGTYQLNIYKSTGPRFISKTYTIDASATWQRIVIPFTGDTNTSGMNDDNSVGFQIAWMLVAGTDYTSGSLQPNWGGWPGNSGFAAGHAVNTASSANNYFRITGIQLELGSQATAFEHRSFAEELTLCQRYYELIAERNEGSNAKENHIGSFWGDGTNSYTLVPFKVKKRAQPTLEISDFSNAFRLYGNSGGNNTNTLSANTLHRDGMMLEAAVNSGDAGYARIFVSGSDGLKALVAAVSEL